MLTLARALQNAGGGVEISMGENEPDLSLLDDFARNPKYERRVVDFYDVLGWRSQIERAGRDANRVGDLRRLILLHVRTMKLRTNWNISVSTFSDNVVITQPLGPMTQRLIAHLAISQLTSGLAGFLL